MFTAWNIVDAGLHRASTGHHYWETKALADELLKRGVEVRIFSHKDAPTERFPGAHVYPTFSLYLYMTVSIDPSWGAVENFVAHSRSFQRDLSRIKPWLFRGALTYFPNLFARQLLATVRWLTNFEDKTRPKTVATILPPADWAENDPSAFAFRTIWADCPAAVKKDLALTVRSTEAADRFNQLLGAKPHPLPSLLGAHERRTAIAANAGAQPSGPIVVSFVAGTRPERGVAQIPEVVKLCLPLGVQFFIQVKNEGNPDVDLEVLTALRAFPNVRLHEGVLDRDAYHDQIARSIVLMPYTPGSYRWRSSGVYNEAKFLGAPVIVGADSWMAEEVKSLGNGLVFEEFTPAAIAACIAQAQREIGRLRERAAICARKFSAENGPDRFVDAVESLFASERS